MKVKIKTLRGTGFEVEAEGSTTVEEFKTIIAPKAEVQPQNQRLIYMGRVLRDQQTLESYDIKEGSTVHMVANAQPQPQGQGQQPQSQPQVQQQPQQPQAQQPNPFGSLFQALAGQNPQGATAQMFSWTQPQPGAQPQGQQAARGQQGQPQPGRVQPQVMRIRLNPQDFMRMMQSGQFPLPGTGQPVPAQGQQGQPGQAQPGQAQPGQAQPGQAQPGQAQPQPAQQPQSQHPAPIPQRQTQPIPSRQTSPAPRPQVQPAPQPQIQISTQPMGMSSLDLELDSATTGGNLDKVKELVERGANIDKGGLHKACMYAHKDIVRYLIEKGAKTEVKLANGETCVHTCAYYGQLELLSYLLDECGANMWERTKDGKTALMLAVVQNYRSVVEELLKRGANVNDSDIHGTTPLITAAQRGNKEIVELLLKFHATVDARDSRGRTALHFASSGGHPHVLSVLLQNGASVNPQNVNHETPLHYAAYHGRRDCVLFLLSKGADTTVRSASGTAQDMARGRGFMDIVQMLQR